MECPPRPCPLAAASPRGAAAGVGRLPGPPHRGAARRRRAVIRGPGHFRPAAGPALAGRRRDSGRSRRLGAGPLASALTSSRHLFGCLRLHLSPWGLEFRQRSKSCKTKYLHTVLRKPLRFSRTISRDGAFFKVSLDQGFYGGPNIFRVFFLENFPHFPSHFKDSPSFLPKICQNQFFLCPIPASHVYASPGPLSLGAAYPCPGNAWNSGNILKGIFQSRAFHSLRSASIRRSLLLSNPPPQLC